MGDGQDTIEYAVNAPVNINGGIGFDTMVAIATEFNDKLVLTKNGIFGAGLSITFINIESLTVYGTEGDDEIYVQSTYYGVSTTIYGGLGSDKYAFVVSLFPSYSCSY